VLGSPIQLPVKMMLGSAEKTHILPLYSCVKEFQRESKQTIALETISAVRHFSFTTTFLHLDYATCNFNSKYITQYSYHAFSKRTKQRNEANSATYEMLWGLG
jgi:hypothetical protein